MEQAHRAFENDWNYFVSLSLNVVYLSWEKVRKENQSRNDMVLILLIFVQYLFSLLFTLISLVRIICYCQNIILL